LHGMASRGLACQGSCSPAAVATAYNTSLAARISEEGAARWPMKLAVNLAVVVLLMSAGWMCLCAQVARPAQRASADVSSKSDIPTFKVDVNLVLVQVSVRDERGHAIANLRQEAFRVFEDGKEQQIRTFSHDELPLAVALVVDNSSSIAAALDELRRGTLDTLALLQPDDEIAIFSFAEKPEMIEGLTNDREAVAEDLWALSPWGGTDINDALYQSAVYLGQRARDRRHAVILISDNEPSAERAHDVHDVVRAALDSGTPIYSIKVGILEHSRTFFLSHSEPSLHDVEKICRQSGGELIDTRRTTSVTSAMRTILAWLKQGYTLGYTSSNTRQDGAYRSIEVRLSGPATTSKHKCTVFARPGYYAPLGH